MLACRWEFLEWGTNINFSFTEFFDSRDGHRRKRGTACSQVMLSPVNKLLCLVWNVNFFQKSFLLKRWPNAIQYDIRYVYLIRHESESFARC